MVTPAVKRGWEGISDLQGRIMRALWALNCTTGEGAVMGDGIAVWITGHWSSYRSNAISELVERGFVDKHERSVFGRTTAFYYSLSKDGISAVESIWDRANEFSYVDRKAQTAAMRAIEF